MAYDSRNLSVLAYANGFTLWHYTTPDDAAGIEEGGYFDDAAAMLRAGDLMLANLDTAGDMAGAVYLVAGASGGTVDIAPVAGGADGDGPE